MLGRLRTLRLRFRQHHWLGLLGLLLLGYFVWHGVNGSRGLLAWRQYDLELDAARLELARLRAEREALAGKVARLRYDSLDPDLLDELARRTLSLTLPLDVIVLLDPQTK